MTPDQGGNDKRVGQWSIQARYDGDSGHKASQATACTVVVNDPS